jgi:hypothetical protein
LPVVLYGCEIWSLTLREECRLRVFENRVLRRIFGPKRDEVTGYWRRLHNKEFNALYFLLNIIRVIKSRRQMDRACSTYGERCIQSFSGKEPLERPSRRWEDNIKMDLRAVGWENGLDRSASGQGEVSGCCECGNEPSGSIKCGEFFE